MERYDVFICFWRSAAVLAAAIDALLEIGSRSDRSESNGFWSSTDIVVDKFKLDTESWRPLVDLVEVNVFFNPSFNFVVDAVLRPGLAVFVTVGVTVESRSNSNLRLTVPDYWVWTIGYPSGFTSFSAIVSPFSTFCLKFVSLLSADSIFSERDFSYGSEVLLTLDLCLITMLLVHVRIYINIVDTRLLYISITYCSKLAR